MDERDESTKTGGWMRGMKVLRLRGMKVLRRQVDERDEGTKTAGG